MSALLWFLLFEDILFLGVIFTFLYLRQRGYTILAMLLFIVLLLTNFISFRVHQNLLLVLLPAITCFILGMFARFFMRRPRITFGVGAARIVIFLFLLLILVLIILSIGVFLYYRH